MTTGLLQTLALLRNGFSLHGAGALDVILERFCDPRVEPLHLSRVSRCIDMWLERILFHTILVNRLFMVTIKSHSRYRSLQYDLLHWIMVGASFNRILNAPSTQLEKLITLVV